MYARDNWSTTNRISVADDPPVDQAVQLKPPEPAILASVAFHVIDFTKSIHFAFRTTVGPEALLFHRCVQKCLTELQTNCKGYLI